MKAKIAMLMFAAFIVISLVSAFQATSVSAQVPITIDGTLTEGEWDGHFWFTDSTAGPGTGYDDDPLPVFSGYITNDDDFLYIAFDVEDSTPDTNRDFLYVTIDMPPAGEFNDPVDALYWGSIPANASFFGEAYLTGDAFPWDRSQRGNTWDTDGVVTARTITDTNRCYELKIPLSAIGAKPGDTIGLKVQARGGQYKSETDPQVVNFYPDMPDGITPIRADTRVEVEGNFEHLTLKPSAEVQALLEEIAKLNETIVEKDSVIAGLQGEKEDLEYKLEAARNRPAQTELDDMTEERDALMDERDVLVIERDDLSGELDYQNSLSRGGGTTIAADSMSNEEAQKVVIAIALTMMGIAAMFCVKSYITPKKTK